MNGLKVLCIPLKTHFYTFKKNILNHREYEKLINTKKLCVFNNFPSVYHLLNSGEWMESYEQWTESYEQKNHVKNRVKFK